MNTFKIIPEGWVNEKLELDEDALQKYIHTGKTLQGIVEQCDENYNLHVKLGKNLEGIIPRAEVEAINVEEGGIPKTNLCTGKVDKFVQFKVKNLSTESVAILSRKEVQQEALNWIKNELQEGQEVIGIVKNIKPYGAFVEIGGGIVGLVHIEDLSVARIKTPFERLKIGQKLKIVVKSIDRETGKVMLSYKEILGTWEDNAKKFKQGTQVKGIVRETEKNKNGIFIELAPNLVGMAEYKEGFTYGQKVEVYIKKIDESKRKIKLSILHQIK